MTEPSNGACVNLVGSAGTTVNADSPAATTLNVPASLGGDVFYLGNAAQAQGCTFRDFVLLANANATHGFEMQWFRGLEIANITVNDTTGDGIVLGEASTAGGHQSNFLLRDVTVSYSTTNFTPASRPAYGVHIEKTAIDSHLDDVVVRNALTAAVYNEGTGNTGYLVHGFGYPYTCTTAPCVNNASSGGAGNASYATSYVIDDVGGGGSVWTDTYADSPSSGRLLHWRKRGGDPRRAYSVAGLDELPGGESGICSRWSYEQYADRGCELPGNEYGRELDHVCGTFGESADVFECA